MIVLIPVSRFLVRYEVAVGLPYSQMERLILQAVAEGNNSIEDIINIFRIPQRLLIQSLVTLTHAGWVALGVSANKQFVLTHEGREALKKDKLPEQTRVRERYAYILLERVTGCVVPEGEVSYISRRVLEQKEVLQRCARLKTQVYDNRLDAGQVTGLLPRHRGERLHWIGDIEMVSKDDHYIITDIDMESRKILNLPNRCRPFLDDYIYNGALAWSERQEEKLEDKRLYSELTKELPQKTSLPDYLFVPENVFSVDASSTSLVYDEHDKRLQELVQNAKSAVFLATGSAQVDGLAKLRDVLVEALQRGVDIDILWGLSSSPDTLNWLRRLKSEMDQADVKGDLRFNRDPSYSNFRVAIADEEDDTYSAIVSSYDWLGECGAKEQWLDLHISVCVKEKALISRLARCLADAWSAIAKEKLSSVPGKWQRIASELDLLVSQEEAPDTNTAPVEKITIRVIHNNEHYGEAKKLYEDAQGVLLVVSPEAKSETLKNIAGVLGKKAIPDDFEGLMVSGDPHDSTVTELQNELDTLKVQLRLLPIKCGNIIVSDDILLTGSYSPLNRYTAPNIMIREISLMIEGPDISARVAQYIKSVAFASR